MGVLPPYVGKTPVTVINFKLNYIMYTSQGFGYCLRKITCISMSLICIDFKYPLPQ